MYETIGTGDVVLGLNDVKRDLYDVKSAGVTLCILDC